jgi:hypothetical protein
LQPFFVQHFNESGFMLILFVHDCRRLRDLGPQFVVAVLGALFSSLHEFDTESETENPADPVVQPHLSPVRFYVPT